MRTLCHKLQAGQPGIAGHLLMMYPLAAIRCGCQQKGERAQSVLLFPLYIIILGQNWPMV